MINQTNEEKAKEIISRSRARNNFGGNITSRKTTNKPCFSGQISELKDIKVEYNPAYPLHEVRTDIEEPFNLVLESIVEHEITHKEEKNGRGCPNTREKDLELILTPISETLREQGIPNVPFGSQGHTVYTYFANLYSDLVVNTIVSDNKGSRGLFLAYDDMATHAGGFGDLFEAFIKLQAMTFPDKRGVSLLPKHFKNSEKASKAYKSFLERTGLLKVPRESRADFMANPEKWEEHSRVFAEEFSKLIDMNSLPSLYFPLLGGNDFTYLDDERVQTEIAMKSYKKAGGQFEPPPFIDSNMALLSVYKRLAKDIEMKVESSSRESRMPITHVSTRKFDPSTDDITKLKYGLNNRGKLEAQTGKFPIEVTARYQTSAGYFPEVRVGLLDCSGSTQRELEGTGKVMNPWAEERNQWTDKSIYHQELLCVFGLFELFRRRGTLKHSNARCGVFSEDTRTGKNLGESERLVLSPSFGGTEIARESLEDIFSGRNSLVYTISDGHVDNWKNIKDTFIEMAKKHKYFHLQIGEETQMYRDLKEAGLKAILNDGKSASKVLIDLTQRDVYGVGGKTQ